MATTRDLKIEQRVVNDFVKAQGKLPSTPDDWRNVHTASYGKELPSEISSLPMYASTSPKANVPEPVMFQGRDVSDSALAGARTAYEEVNKPSSFLSQVKERLATKFKPDSVALSIDPFSATLGELNPSQALNGLALQSQAVRRKGALALQSLTTASDIYGERATNALNNLNQLEAKRTAFETEQKATETGLKSLALELAKKGKDLPEDLLNLLPANLRSVYKAMPAIFKEETSWSGLDLGGGLSGGGIVKTATGDAYDIGSYATDPNHEKAVQGILQNIGQFKTVNDINNYITTKYPSSPVTGEMVAKASEKYGVSWEMITAIMEQDSSMGTAGKAVRTFNPGNVGNTDSGAEVNYKDWQSGVDAVAKNLAGRKTTATTDTAQAVPAFDNIISQGLSAPEEMARLKALAGNDEKRTATLVAQFDAYKASKPQATTGDVTKLAQDAFEGIKRKTLTYNQIVGKDDAETIAIKQEVLRLQAGDKTISESDKMVNQSLNDKLAGINEIINDTKGLKYSVGYFPWDRRAWTPFDSLPNAVAKARAGSQAGNFIASVEQMTSQDTLNTLINLKKSGGTLGAVSETELAMLKSASNKINTWAVYDGSGKIKGYKIDEAVFKKELNRIKDIMSRAVQNAGGSSGIINTLEQALSNNPDKLEEYNILAEQNPGISDDDIMQLLGIQ